MVLTHPGAYFCTDLPSELVTLFSPPSQSNLPLWLLHFFSWPESGITLGEYHLMAREVVSPLIGFFRMSSAMAVVPGVAAWSCASPKCSRTAATLSLLRAIIWL